LEALVLSRKLVARLDPRPMPPQLPSQVPSYQMQVLVFASAAAARLLRQVFESLLAVVMTPRSSASSESRSCSARRAAGGA
jgi:hypothetical protein